MRQYRRLQKVTLALGSWRVGEQTNHDRTCQTVLYHGETMAELDSPRGDESFRGHPMWLQASTWGRGPSYRRAQSLGASALGPPGCLRLEPAGRSWWHTSFSSRHFTSHTNVPTAQACNGILLWAPGARGLLASIIGVWRRITRPFCERAALAGNEQPNGRGQGVRDTHRCFCLVPGMDEPVSASA